MEGLLIEKRRRWRNPLAAGACGVLMGAALLVSTACADAPAVTSATAAAAAPSVASTVTTAAAAPSVASPAPASPSPAGVQAGATSAPTAPVLAADVTVEQFVQNILAGPHDMIASADGGAELLIPQGALPSGVAAKDIAITKLAPADAPFTIEGEPPLVAYQLAPDALQFVQPIAIRLRGLAAGAELPGVFRIAGKRVTLLDRVWVESDPASGTARVTGLLSGFSTVAVSARGIFQVSIANPGPQVVDKPFTVTAVVKVARTQKLKFPDGVTGFTLHLVDNWNLKGLFFSLGPLTPPEIDPAPAASSVQGDAFTADGTFKCVTTGAAAAELGYNLKVGGAFEFVHDDGQSVYGVESQDLQVRTGKFDCVAPPTPAPPSAATPATPATPAAPPVASVFMNCETGEPLVGTAQTMSLGFADASVTADRSDWIFKFNLSGEPVGDEIGLGFFDPNAPPPAEKSDTFIYRESNVFMALIQTASGRALWVTDDRPGGAAPAIDIRGTITTEGDLWTVRIPMDRIPANGTWFTYVKDGPKCAVIGLGEDGKPTLPLPSNP